MPAWWIVRANSICLSVRLRSGLSDSSLERMSSELSGVRSSWLMFARNSLLYFEVSASSRACSSSALARELDLAVLQLDVAVLLAEQRRLLLQLLVGLAQLLLLGLQQLLGGLQRLRLLLELGVGAPQLLLLGLQLLRALLQLARELLRLLEQLLGALVGDDRVEHDAERLGQLLEERLVDLGERRRSGRAR